MRTCVPFAVVFAVATLGCMEAYYPGTAFDTGGIMRQAQEQALSTQRAAIARGVASVRVRERPLAGSLAVSLPGRETIARQMRALASTTSGAADSGTDFAIPLVEEMNQGEVQAIRRSNVFARVEVVSETLAPQDAKIQGFDYLLQKLTYSYKLIDTNTSESQSVPLIPPESADVYAALYQGLVDGLASAVTGPQIARREEDRPAASPLGKIGQRWAVVVGIAEYKARGDKLESLKYADKDARAFRDFLVSEAGGGFAPDHVLLLTNEEATTRDIRKGLFTFLKSAIREDLVVVFFSGHGAGDPDRPENLYLLTYDTDAEDISGTAFPMDDVKKALANTIEAQRVVVLADACHSGGVANAGGTKGIRVATRNDAINRYWAELSKTGPGRVIFASSQRDEVSQEDARWGGGHGVFTWVLLEGLKGAADADGDGIVTIGEAIRYTDEHVRRETRSAQHPTVAGEQYDAKLPMGVLR